MASRPGGVAPGEGRPFARGRRMACLRPPAPVRGTASRKHRPTHPPPPPPQDVLVVTAPGSGAEVIPFLKTWVNLPMAVGFAVLYAKMADTLSNEALFYTCIIPFILFFGAFAFALYPARDLIHPTALCERLVASAPRLAAPIAILRNWTYCLFYVMAELWGSVVVSVLFWGFANQVRFGGWGGGGGGGDEGSVGFPFYRGRVVPTLAHRPAQITTVDEAKQFYPLFGLGANVALIFSGRAVKVGQRGEAWWERRGPAPTPAPTLTPSLLHRSTFPRCAPRCRPASTGGACRSRA